MLVEFINLNESEGDQFAKLYDKVWQKSNLLIHNPKFKNTDKENPYDKALNNVSDILKSNGFNINTNDSVSSTFNQITLASTRKKLLDTLKSASEIKISSLLDTDKDSSDDL